MIRFDELLCGGAVRLLGGGRLAVGAPGPGPRLAGHLPQLKGGGGGGGSRSRPGRVAIDRPCIGVCDGEAANSMEMGHAEAVLYRYENHQLTTVNQWFFDYQ